jgi:7-cyano-7-deazaguanine synthase
VMTVLLLSSGGLDSTTVAYWLVQKGMAVQPLFFDYSQHCVEKEWDTLKAVLPQTDLIAPPTRVDISAIYRGSGSRLITEPDLWREHVDAEDLYLPYRTLLFISVSACIAQTRGIFTVYSGFINSNHAKELDCSAEFLNGLDSLSRDVGPVRFEMPFRERSKAEIVQLAKQLGVPIGRTYSCQLSSDIPCGACPNCVERLTAIEAIGT